MVYARGPVAKGTFRPVWLKHFTDVANEATENTYIHAYIIHSR